MHRPWSGQSNINFHMRDIWRNVLPKFIELCLERHACAHSNGHQHGGRKQQKHLSLSFATLKCEFMSPGTDNIKGILFLIFMSCSDSKIPFSAVM